MTSYLLLLLSLLLLFWQLKVEYSPENIRGFSINHKAMKKFEDIKKGDVIYYYNGTEFIDVTVQHIFPACNPYDINIEVNAFINPVLVSKLASIKNFEVTDNYLFTCKEIIDLFISDRQKFFNKMKDDAYEFFVDKIFKTKIDDEKETVNQNSE